MNARDEADPHDERERRGDQRCGQGGEEVPERREGPQGFEREHEYPRRSEEGELGVRGGERPFGLVPEPKERGGPAGHAGREERDEQDDKDHGHGDGRRQREAGEEQVRERDRRDEHDGVEEDGRRPPVERGSRDVFELTPLPLGGQQRRGEADEDEGECCGEEARVRDAGEDDGRRGQDVEVGPEGGEGEGPARPLEGFEALLGRGAGGDHVYQDEGSDVEHGAEHVSQGPRRRLEADAPAGQGGDEGPDLGLVAGGPDRVPSDAQHQEHRHDPEVVRHPGQQLREVEPPGDHRGTQRRKRDQCEGPVERAGPRHGHREEHRSRT